MPHFHRAAGRRAQSFALAVLLAPAISAAHASGVAQGSPDASHEPPAAHTRTLQTVIVTATPIAIRQLDASYSVTTADRAAIRDVSPFSAADLLNLSPGIWAESSTGGGNAGKVFVSGYVMSRGSPFLTAMVDGTPLFAMPQVSFLTNLQLVRLDDTIERVEIVQGGPSAIFGPGQMGATANFVLRQGTPQPSGDVALTYGTGNLRRLDGFYGFELAPGWRASIGGFYRVASGIRNPQFKADRGGQLTATLSHRWDTGSLLLWGRVLDDKNQFYNQYPMIELPDGAISSYPGFDPLTATYYSRAVRRVQIPSPNGGLLTGNLDDGRGADARFFGGTSEQRVGPLHLTDRFGYTGGTVPVAGLFPKANPSPLGYYLYGCNAAEPSGWCVDGKPVDKNNLGYPADRTVSATLPDGATVPLDASVIQQGWYYNRARIENFVNDLRGNVELFSGNTLTGGLYLDRSTLHATTSTGNQMLMLNQPNTLPIGVTYSDDGGTVVVANPQGFIDMNHNQDSLQMGTAWNRALYLSDTWAVGAWLLQAGGRVEQARIRERSCNTAEVDLDGNPLTLYDNAVPICDGTFDREDYRKTHPAFTAAANYALGERASVYVRANTGVAFDDFSDGVENAHGDFAPVQKIRNLQVGWKYQSRRWLVDVDAYQRLFSGLQYQEENAEGVPIPGQLSIYGANTHGVDAHVALTPVAHLSLDFVGNYMQGHNTHHDGCAPFVDVDGESECVNFNGRPIELQPKLHYRFTPTWTQPTAFGSVTGFLTFTYVGRRYADQTGLQALPAYHTLDAGIVVENGRHWEYRLQGTNLTNSIALVTGNTRVLGVASGVDGVMLARTLQGRQVFLQARYRF